MVDSAGAELWQPVSRLQRRAQYQLPSSADAASAFGDVAARDGGAGDVRDVIIEFNFSLAVLSMKLFTPTGTPHFIADTFAIFKYFNATHFACRIKSYNVVN